MEAFMKKGEELEKSLTESRRKLAEAQRRVQELVSASTPEAKADLAKAQEEEKQLKKQERSWEKKMQEHRIEEKKMPWNVDTLSKEGFSKSVVNVKPEKEEETEEEKEEKHKTFVEKYEKQIKHFGMLRRWDDSQKYLSDNPHLTADQQYQDAFNDELESFKERVRGRAKIRIEKALKEYEEEERQKRLGPGGLDPVEVYETLPPEMQKCFDDKDIQMLQDAITKMDPTEAKYHMKRCIDSGLWVPNAQADEEGDKDKEESDEPQYEEVKKADQ
ncbi:hypothetical protein cypCar_00048968 [Cyprinus carpio]|nr:hypothetical protein cypCar_00048968 [Cyprinus carpio]